MSSGCLVEISHHWAFAHAVPSPSQAACPSPSKSLQKITQLLLHQESMDLQTPGTAGMQNTKDHDQSNRGKDYRKENGKASQAALGWGCFLLLPLFPDSK